MATWLSDNMLDIFMYYDRPILYSRRWTGGSVALVQLIDDDHECETWLVACMSPERMEQVKAGAVDLYDAFKRAEKGYVLRVVEPYRKARPRTCERIPCEALTDDMLAVPGYGLND